MKDREFVKIVKRQGETMNFSLGLYENATDKENTKFAKKIAKEFVSSFGKFCEENKLEMVSGISEFPTVGSSSFIAVRRKDDLTALMIFMVPHDIIEVKDEQ